MPAFALAPGLAPAIDSVWLAAWSSPVALPAYRSLADSSDLNDDPASPSFDIGGYRALWDDTKFSEISAYGGLERAAERVAGMRAIDGSDGVSGEIPYGQLTIVRDFLDGQDQLELGTYGTAVSVRPTAISGFGDDSYTDVAIDGTWRFVTTPERSTPDVFSTHVLFLHEDENLIASHAIFGTNKSDELTVLRGDASWSWGNGIAPSVQYFRISGTSDPVRLGTLDGSPHSNGAIAEISYTDGGEREPLSWCHATLSLEYVAYSDFDGSSRNASENNTLLLHLSANFGPAP